MAKGKGFDLENYDMVKDRIDAYIEEYPDYRVETEVVFTSKPSADVVIVKAYVYKNREDQLEKVPHGTGIAEETRDAGFVNKTSHVENAETSAIGRALANVAFKIGEKRPSAEEMDKVQRTQKAKSKKKKDKDTNPKKEEKQKEVEADDDGRVADEDMEEAIKQIDSMPKVVKFFNTQMALREGEEKKEFEDEFQPVANARIKELKDNG